MACPDCSAASERLWHGFRMGCKGCCARAAARSPQFRAARVAGKLLPDYRRLLQQFELTHEQVKAAAEADALGKAEA